MQPATLALDDQAMMMLFVCGGIGVALVSIVGGIVHSLLKTRAREQTKRELAAYVAEGTMSAEDAERILQSDVPIWERGPKT